MKSSAPEQRITIKTDALYDDSESLFTIMHMEGSIDDFINPYKLGDVIKLSDVSVVLANESDLEAVVVSPSTDEIEIPQATAKFLSIDVFGVWDETTYRKYIAQSYRDQYSYEESAPSLPWLAIKTKKTVQATPFTLEISHDGNPCTFGGTSSNVGTPEGAKITISQWENVMFDCRADLGVENPSGKWLLKFTMNNIVDQREVNIP